MYRNQKPDFSTLGHSDHSSRPRWALRAAVSFLLLVTASLSTSGVYAFRVIDVTESLGLAILRWDAEPHFVDGVERSLDGGLRYSVEGGSYAAFRDKFIWADPAPTVAEFQTAVEQAFAVWEAVDLATGLGTSLYFVPDFDTPIEIVPGPLTLPERLRLNPGAEIDLTSRAGSGGTGNNSSFADPSSNSVSLTSGVTNYPAAVLSGSDISIDSTSFGGSPWQLENFKSLLLHEIGHALGLADVDFPSDAIRSLYYDDNFDDTTQQSALDTLTNPFAQLIDAFDPDNSPALNLYEPCDGGADCPSSPGLDTFGVNIAMESSAVGWVRDGLRADDFAGRQFLYPVVHWGDANGDGHIDASDYLIWAANYGANPADNPPGPQLNGDFNYDGAVDGLDYLAWARGYGQGQADGAAVPEPGTLMLAGLALVLLAGRRTRAA